MSNMLISLEKMMALFIDCQTSGSVRIVVANHIIVWLFKTIKYPVIVSKFQYWSCCTVRLFIYTFSWEESRLKTLAA